MTNPPSIPSHENVFGYEENDKGELVKQKNTEKAYTGVKGDTVGPGNYDVVKGLGAEKKGPTWHTSKTKKKVPENQVALVEQPGPGHYNADKVDVFPIYKYKPSSVFVSKVERDQNMKTLKAQHALSNKPLSQQNTSYNMLGNDDDYYEDDEDDGQAPGPGSYFNPRTSTTFKVKQVPERLQFFGSTVERFINKQMEKAPTAQLGPGSYNLHSATNKKMRNTTYVPFATSENRFQEL